MKINPEDPKLTAFVLDELQPDDAAAIERALAEDPALKTAIDDLDGISQLLTDSLLAAPKPKLLVAQRETILKAARNPENSKIVKISEHRRPLGPIIATIAAAALIVFSIIVFTRIPFVEKTVVGGKPLPGKEPDSPAENGEQPEWRTIPINIALLPAPGPVDNSRGNRSGSPVAASTLARAAAAHNEAIARNGSAFMLKAADLQKDKPIPAASELPQLTRRGSVSASMSPQLQLPVQAGSLSFSWVTKSVRQDHKLPPANAVRVEEILNQFAIRPAGPAAVAQGVTLSTETLPCPWKPSASLLIVSLRGAAEMPSNVQATFKADSSSVMRYRLIGYAPVTGVPEGTLPTELPPKAMTIVAIEIEPIGVSHRYGTVEWTVNGQPAPPVSLNRQPGAEPSDDARFASLLCAYGQWLAGDEAGIIDGEIVAALAREIAADHLPPDRFDLLNLIDQSLNL